MSTGQAWVELVGDLVVARVRGEPTEQLLRATQEKVLFYNDMVAAVKWLSEEA